MASQRELREIHNPKERARELAIKNMMATYGYGHEDAEKMLEITNVKVVEALYGAAVGGVAAWKAGPIMKNAADNIRLFRKPWLRYSGQIASFAFFYYVGTQLPERVFYKVSPNNTGITHDTMVSRSDLVARFRLFEDPNRDAMSLED